MHATLFKPNSYCINKQLMVKKTKAKVLGNIDDYFLTYLSKHICSIFIGVKDS